ncbi:MAG: HAD-IC family P-type ATPase [Clostridiales bacterium]|nr:HAD-IC family P-type ATPase [Clostridiales bacterium]MDO4350678.1 HAD-IC family P-type ATPase [Eubacteriales bacterium]MDY4008917.1 HAD-IC family P-type ATPase [Candidatus Limiplasma sp.]
MQPTTDDFEGLSSQEAAGRAANGQANRMPRQREGGVADILRRHVLTLFNLLNLALAALLFWVGSHRDMLFLGVVVSNTLIGVVQELRAKRTHDRLQLLSEGRVRVLRDGAECQLPPQELVLGDVALLSRGDQTPADAEVLCGLAQVDESLLTGESEPVNKGPGDRLYSGSFLVGGGVTVRLTAVGAQSYAGQLQLAARKVRRPSSELMRDMRRIIRWVSALILPIGISMFLKQYFTMDVDLQGAVTKTVASMLGMIPEGLILLTSVSLAVGVVKLGRSNALVNELFGIETLARTDVVCMDKTGTLTSGEMTLEETLPLNGASQEEIAACLGALLGTFPDETPTTRALAAAYPASGAQPVAAVPFSSARKWSAGQWDALGTVVLGAPERLAGGGVLEQAQAQAAQGRRVLMLARTLEALNGEELPGGLAPVALLCLRDSLRPNVQKTVRYFGQQDVALKVISGDSPLTASHAALAAGVPGAGRMVDLSLLSGEKDYAALCREYTVFGRVSPEDKRGLVEALKADGHNVAMVGDGVNDIPALKAADCSIAMAGGSDAACRVAQICLLNADFDVLPQIVLEGRRVINNITRASSLFLVKNIFSLLLSVLLLALPFVYPFAPIQLTLVSALTIGVPSFVLALQPSRDRVRGSFLRNVIMRALPGGVCTAALIIPLMAFSNRLGFSAETVSTLSTLIAGYSGMVALFLTCLPLNPLRGALVALMSAAFAAAVLFFPQVFYLTPIAGTQWAMLAAAAVLAPVVQVGLGALVRRAGHKRPAAAHPA